jgi:hypothetical protein
MANFILGYAVGQVIKVLLFYFGYCWNLDRTGGKR